MTDRVAHHCSAPAVAVAVRIVVAVACVVAVVAVARGIFVFAVPALALLPFFGADIPSVSPPDLQQ
jgi:hypothetical protein